MRLAKYLLTQLDRYLQCRYLFNNDIVHDTVHFLVFEFDSQYADTDVLCPILIYDVRRHSFECVCKYNCNLIASNFRITIPRVCYVEKLLELFCVYFIYLLRFIPI